MKRHAIAVSTMLLLIAATPTWQPDTAARKCQLPGAPILFPDAPEDVYVLNGKEISPDDMKLVNKKDYESIEFVCPVQLHQVFGVKAQRTGVVVFTTPGPHAAMKSALADVTARQEKYFGQHRAFGPQLAAVGRIGATFFPAQRRLGHRPVHRHPAPVDPDQAIIGQKPLAPEFLEHPGVRPLAKAAVG